MAKGQSSIPKPAVDSYRNNILDDDQRFQNDANVIYNAMKEGEKRIPFYSSGARALIKVAGKPLGVCQSFRWSVSYQSGNIQTIDDAFPVDIDVGPANITANLSQIIDPTRGPEHDGIFHIMSAAVHQPLVELQVLDKSGTSLFFSRGMFTSINGNVSLGSMSNWSANFQGIAYQHYVSQNFKPYNSVSSGLSNLIDGLQNLTSDLTGGFL